MRIRKENRTSVPSVEAMRREFRTPPPHYGPIDCWWWEGASLSKEKMRLQLEEMKAKGVRGTWFYPRFVGDEPLGSDPAYWTEEWWDFIAFSMREHKRLGLVAWVSDWTAHEYFQNKVRAERCENTRLTGRRLVIYQRSASGPGPVGIEVPAEEEVLHAAAYRQTDVGLDYASQQVLRDAVVNNRLTWPAPDEGWVLTIVAAQPHDLDYLDPAIADRWLQLHLQAFEDRLPDYVGSTLQAYGPDEMFVLRGNILYSPTLVARFKREKGYDPLPYLVGLFQDIGDKTDKIRCDYYDVMVSLLDENFYRRIADWLHERGMLYSTIATWGRLNPADQTYHYGDFFRMMSHFDVTGNEDPGPGDVEERRFIDAKLSSSIAHLCERDRIAVCAYWGSGWGVTQQQNLTWTLANYAFGVNLYNRHGVLYSTLGGWYEWVPPAVHFRQPYWQYWKCFTDWVRRLSYIMSQGTHVADAAVLYPLTTMHAGWGGGENFSETAREASEKVMHLAKVIYRRGIDFDFIDDRFLSQAEVSNGKLTVAGHAFQAVLLPPLTTIRRETLEKLREFYATGGTVLAFGRLPDASPEHGRNDPVVRSIIEEMFGTEPVATLSSVSKRESSGGGKAFFVPADEGQVPSILSEAIARDVAVSEQGVFHTHRKAGDANVFLLFNTKPERRHVSVTVRACGEPEIWDPFTGHVRSLYCFESQADLTTVHLDLEPYQGIVLVLAPPQGRARVTTHNLDRICSLHPGESCIHTDGLCETGGRKVMCLAHGGIEYVGEAEVDDPAEAICLDGMWSFRLQPTMDNSWGDFRYPPSKELIGPEARQFRYMEEEQENGVSSAWHEPTFDDADWPLVTYSYGPYWWCLGPFGEANEPKHILEEVITRGFNPEETFDLAERQFRWEPLSFSMKYGAWQTPEAFGGLEGVSDDFLAFDAVPGGQNVVRYLFAHVVAPEEGEWTFDLGGTAEFPRQAWVNGEQVISGSFERPQAETRVRLQKGTNAVLLRIVQPQGQALKTYAAFFEPSSPPAANPRIPLLRWFREPQKLLFDVTLDRQDRVGWYRFLAPPGLRSMRFRLLAESVEAWVNGSPVTVQPSDCPQGSPEEGEFTIALGAALKECSQIALRVALKPGRYAGAAFDGPVVFECEEGLIPLGDWCDYGLEMYSGTAVYSRTVHLDKHHINGGVWLELGTVATVSEVFVNGKTAGVGTALPFRFDITNLVTEGENVIEVKVANTLANHMSSYPTKYIFPGQITSGLLGPVRVQFARKVTMTAVPTTGA